MELRRSTPAGSPVAIDEVSATGGRRWMVATLDSEKTLNSLSLPMIEVLAPALDRWERDPAVVGIVLQGAGGRAFCAGGDVQALYESMKRNLAAGHRVDDYAETFFEREYRLDYRIHRFPKPVVCIGHGIVMGGGLGLYSASRFRVVTESSRIAMPEVTIGLFPDAGATWILRHLPPQIALYLGVTGSHMNATDALHLGLATHSMQAALVAGLPRRLAAIDWRGDPSDMDRLEAVLEQSALQVLPDGVVEASRATLLERMPTRPQTAAEAAEAVRSLRGQSAWFDRGIATLDRGCPTSVGIVVEQLRRASTLSLADVFRLELVVATHCARRGEFAEGVRALLIDKDNAPRWQHASAAELPAAVVAEHFVAPWPAHPLADLV